MKIGAIFIGFLFLINPDLITLDIFPDFIGYLLIGHGLYRLSFLEERIATARRWCHILAGVEAGKLFANLAVFSTRVESTRMTISFFFFIAEVWMGILLVDSAMKGLQYLAIRRNGDLALKGYEVSKTFLTLFIVVKSVCAFLPSFVIFFFPDVDSDPEKVEGYTAILRSFQTIRSAVFVICSVVALCLGIYTARILKAYLARCRSDLSFCESLKEYYSEKVTQNTSLQTRLAIKGAFGFFFLSLLFSADLYLDDLPMIPVPFLFLFAYLGFRRLKGIFPLPKWVTLSPLLGFVVSLAGLVFRTVLLYTRSDFPVYFVTSPIALIFGIVTVALAALSAFAIVSAVNALAKKYTEYSYRLYAAFVLLGTVAAAILGFYQFRYPSTFTVLPSVQWLVVLAVAYFHKKSMDEIFSEIEYRLL